MAYLQMRHIFSSSQGCYWPHRSWQLPGKVCGLSVPPQGFTWPWLLQFHKTSKQPPSLLLSHTLVKEFAVCFYITGDCTTAGFDGWITAADTKTSVPVSVKLLSLSAPKWLLCIWKYMWFPAAFLLTSPLVWCHSGLGGLGIMACHERYYSRAAKWV